MPAEPSQNVTDERNYLRRFRRQYHILFESCTCPFWTKHLGRYACKHLLGWKRLLERQAQQQEQQIRQPGPEFVNTVEVEA